MSQFEYPKRIFWLIGLTACAATLGHARGREGQFTVGVCTHFSQGKGHVAMNLDMIQAAGIRAIRDEASWSSVERTQGTLQIPTQVQQYVGAAASRDIEVMMILDYANRFYDQGDRPRSAEAIEGFCQYAEFIVRHLSQDIGLYEIWNEWDIGIGLPKQFNRGGSAEDYVRLLRAAYPRIKAVNARAIVVAGACTSGAVNRGWLQEIVNLGALDYCDAVSIHGYNYSAQFPQRSPETCMAWMTGIQAMLGDHHGGQDVPFYVTEMGWPNQTDGRGTAPQLSASYLARLYLLARTEPWFRGLWWYDFQDDGWDPKHNENNFGLVRPDLTPKPHYHVLADISSLVTQAEFRGELEAEDKNLRILRFRQQDTDVWALWSADDQDRQVILQADNPPDRIVLHQVGSGPYTGNWGLRDWADGQRDYMPNQFSLVVGHRPVLLRADLQGVTVREIRPRIRSGTYGYH